MDIIQPVFIIIIGFLILKGRNEFIIQLMESLKNDRKKKILEYTVPIFAGAFILGGFYKLFHLTRLNSAISFSNHLLQILIGIGTCLALISIFNKPTKGKITASINVAAYIILGIIIILIILERI